jgi:hypothetical protein
MLPERRLVDFVPNCFHFSLKPSIEGLGVDSMAKGGHGHKLRD